MKILLVVAELFHSDRGMGGMKDGDYEDDRCLSQFSERAYKHVCSSNIASNTIKC
jgi:hypothetical protein